MEYIINRIRTIASAVLLAACFIPLLFWRKLEGVRFPSHYNAAGVVDGYAGRLFFLEFAFVALLIFVVMQLARLYPKLCNYPVKITDSNRDAVYAIGNVMLSRLCAVIMALTCYMANGTLLVALGIITRLALWPVWLIVAIILSLAVLFYIQCRRLG